MTIFSRSWANRETSWEDYFSSIISQQDKDAGITINQSRPELKFKVVGTLDDNARGDLSDEMADLCANLPIHLVVKVDRAPTDLASDVAPMQRRCNSRILQVNIRRITDILTAENDMKTCSSDHRSYTHKLRICKNKAWQQQQQQKQKQKGLNGIRAHNLCYAGALLY